MDIFTHIRKDYSKEEHRNTNNYSKNRYISPLCEELGKKRPKWVNNL